MDRNITADLVEAYASIYQTQEEPQFLSENYNLDNSELVLDECYIAAQYLVQEGLDEYAIEDLIEEMGLNEFVNFVYDIFDEYVLTEARRGQPRGSQREVTGKKRHFKDITDKGVKTKAAKRTPEHKKRAAERGNEPELTDRQRRIAQFRNSPEVKKGREKSAERLNVVRGKAVPTARKPTAVDRAVDRAADVIRSGVARHNKAMTGAGELAKVAGRAARLIGTNVLKPAAAGFFGTLGGAGHVAAKGLNKEEIEYLLSYLIDEGYANDVDSAFVILENMSDLWVNVIFEEVLDERNRGERGMSDEEVRRRRNLGLRDPRMSSSAFGDHGPQSAIQRFHRIRGKKRTEAHKSRRHMRHDTEEGGRYEANKDHKDGYPSIKFKGSGPG